MTCSPVNPMGIHSSECSELFHGLRRAWNCKPRAESAPPKSSNPSPTGSGRRGVNKIAAADPVYGFESVRREVLTAFAAVEASLSKEIRESKLRESKLRQRLAKSRGFAQDLQAKFINHEREWGIPPISSCEALRHLARNQVVSAAQMLTPEFARDLKSCCYGQVPWSSVLAWLDDHPETVASMGLNLHILRSL